ncbi:MAG: Gfo/Idh/MocA family oxidoreductase [Verrucomicrobiales bacterium]|nr:Gfo/Idh/MocA family oxidoreductase [Verrucomicrobiales bacterium]MCP5528736.1 Gfo/Idh/MocA family oxidoreductase [Verrucomicrobiales bacterium]
MHTKIDRRRFLSTAAATGMFTIVPRQVLGGQGTVAPNSRITLAHIGMGTQSISELGGLLEEPALQIVAVCDPNRDSHDYVEWGRNSIRSRIRSYLGNPTWREGRSGCPGGREVGREVIDTYYAKQRGTDRFRGVTPYVDFRELLEKERDIDAVKVMTPDHLHATVAVAALKRGRHVLMHKPLANRLREGRLVIGTARQTGRETHLLAYGSGADNARIAAAVRDGVIGRLREIHNWTNRPVWPQYTELPPDRPAVPPGFEWDLWLGPAQPRPYHPHYTHTVFRGWYEFGGGSMADMGIYSLWPVFTTLGLDSPVSASAWATHTCTIEDHVSRTVANDFAYPTACALRFKFAARGDRPGIELFWYDGGMKPRLPEVVEAHDVTLDREGILFVGDEGAILAGFRGDGPRLFGKGAPRPLTEAAGSGEAAEGRAASWLRAFQGGEASPGSFLNAGPITDTVNLGTVALRAGTRVEFDAAAMRITNVESANRFLTRDYRKGWEL